MAFNPKAEGNLAPFFHAFGVPVELLDGVRFTGILDWNAGETVETGFTQQVNIPTLTVRASDPAIPRYERIMVDGAAYTVQSTGMDNGEGFRTYQIARA